MEKLLDWFDKTEGQGYGFAKVVYEAPTGICARLFSKAECERGVDSYFKGYCDALDSLDISYLSQMEGYDLWYFPKGGATAEKIRSKDEPKSIN